MIAFLRKWISGVLALCALLVGAWWFFQQTASYRQVDALVRRAIPCALYDCAAAIVFYPLALRFAVAESPLGGSAPAAGPIVGSTAARAASPIVKSTAAPTASPLLRPSAKSKRRR